MGLNKALISLQFYLVFQSPRCGETDFTFLVCMFLEPHRLYLTHFKGMTVCFVILPGLCSDNRRGRNCNYQLHRDTRHLGCANVTVNIFLGDQIRFVAVVANTVALLQTLKWILNSVKLTFYIHLHTLQCSGKDPEAPFLHHNQKGLLLSQVNNDEETLYL